MTDTRDTDPERSDLHSRRDALSAAIEAQRNAEADARAARLANRPGVTAEAGAAMNLGFRVLAELIAGILVGLALGYGLDTWLHTRPIFLIVFLFLGTAAGVWNVVRAAATPSGRSGRS